MDPRKKKILQKTNLYNNRNFNTSFISKIHLTNNKHLNTQLLTFLHGKE